MLNADVDWEGFPADPYLKNNYSKLAEDDRQILEHMRDFFAGAGAVGGSGLDVGCGPNFYPSMAQLPFCDNVTLIDFCSRNVDRMSEEIGRDHGPDPSWDAFWAVLRVNPAYLHIEDFRALLKGKAKVQYGNVLELDPRQYDIGTMFFVAESMTGETFEFREAVHKFVGSLRKGAPFAMAFMTGSNGYPVDGKWFPAVSISREDVRECLTGEAEEMEFHDIGMREPRLREGYEGMLLATGRSSSGRESGR